MAKDRFSPVNEVAEISSPITSPGRPECAEQPTDDIAVSAAGQTSVQTDQSHVDTEVTDQGEVIEAVSVPEISETGKEASEQDRPTEKVSDTKGESSLVDTKAHENRKSVESPSQDEVTFCTNQSKADESADHNCECICTCTRPIPLPQEGISYIASRNFLEEQGADLRSKQSHEKRTYIIGQLPKAGSSENVFDYSGLIAELPRLSGTQTRHSGQSFYTSHQQAGLNNTAFIPTITKTVGPIVQCVSQPNHTAHTTTTMSGSIQPSNTFAASFRRSQEREELQQLNDRFAVYVQQVRQLGQEFSQLDSSAFLRSCRLLEDQIQNIKNLYEKELDNVRLQLEAVSRERNQYKMEAEKNQMAAMDLQTRLSAECNKSTKLTDDLNSCHRQMMVLEQEVAEYRSSQHAVGQAQQIQRDLENLNIENQQLRGRYEQEHISCQEAHDRVVQSDKKLEFDRQVNQAAVTELKERLDAANANILSLETRLREVSQPGGNLGDMLQKVREAAAVELQKYQAESEDRFNRNITNLRAQAEEDGRRISSLRLENEDFLRQRADFENQIRSLQAKLNSSDHQVQTMKETLAMERTRYGNQVASMDRKARQLQDLLLDKMHEANVAREMQVPLKAEIEAFKVLLEDEERRLQHSHGSAIHTPDFHGTTASNSQAKLVCSPAVRSFASPSSSQPFPPVSQSPSQPYPQSSQSQVTPHHTHTQSTVYPPASQSPPNPLPIQSPNFPYVPNTTAGYTSQGESYRLTKADTGYNSQGDSFVVPTAPLSVHIEEPHDRKHSEVRPGSHTPQQTKPSVYTYQTNPSVNKLNLEHEINQRVGPITRAKSAPATRQSSQLVSANLGEGRDYFDEMFIEGKRGGNLGPLRPYSSPVSSCHDYNTATVSSIGELKVLEVNHDGKYVRLVNTGETDAEIGGHMIQQNVGGHPVAVYRFKPHTRLAAHKTVTVWSGLSDPLLHQPPTDFVWREQQRWGTGPECTTILCRPNGQAIAWTTAAHRFARNPFEAESRSTTQEPRLQGRERDFEDEEVLTELHVNGAAIQPDPVFLKREKQTPPSLSVTKHPHGSSPKKRTHPQTRPERPWTSGNDNSSVNRQSRSQTCTPDHPKGQPYAGPLSHKVGGSVARSYAPPPGITMNGSGRLANQATDPGVTSMPPSAFMKPRDRFDVGLTQIQSQHHNYNSPMPRPPLHSAW